MEQFPRTDKVLYHIDVRARLDVKVARIKEAANVQTRNQLVGLVFRIGTLTLTVQVEVITLRCLQIALFERFPMPGTVTLRHVHVVHVDGHPHIRRGIGNFVVHMLINQEIVGLGLAILDVIDARLTDTGKVELHIIIFIIRTPRDDITLEGLLSGAVGVEAHQTGRTSLHGVVLVQFDDSHLRLFGGITHLRETDVGFTNPTRNGVWFYCPCDDLPRLTCW